MGSGMSIDLLFQERHYASAVTLNSVPTKPGPVHSLDSSDVSGSNTQRFPTRAYLPTRALMPPAVSWS